jgi:sec-independent protein translocase protein TatA
LILFGAKKLPELAKGLGQGIKEFKKATRDVTDEIHQSMEDSNYSAPSPKQVEPAAKKLSESSEPEKTSAVSQAKEHTS